MTQPESRKLVVDANIAQSAGKSDSQMSIDARNLLETMRDCGHCIVWTTEIEQEWNRHFTEFSLDWFTAMTSTDKVLDLRDANVKDLDLRRKIRKSAQDEHINLLLQKDVHLLEAALSADKSIVSKDKRARRHFKDVSLEIEIIRDVVWVNPDVADDKCIDWLKRGAPPEAHRQLGHRYMER